MLGDGRLDARPVEDFPFDCGAGHRLLSYKINRQRLLLLAVHMKQRADDDDTQYFER